jgi:F0F1-type ATP synthase membrane subunit c/vacuolar-type H+-ATPase subunit K
VRGASCSVSLAAVGVGFALGALPGAGVGALVKTREWDEAQPSRIKVGVAPVRGRGVAAQLTLRF